MGILSREGADFGGYWRIISLDNLRLADEKARKGKLRSYGVKRHDRN